MRWTRWDSFLATGADERGRNSRKGSTVHTAWKTRHDLAENACPECQGSAFVPGSMHEGRMVDECPKCEGTGKGSTKKAA